MARPPNQIGRRIGDWRVIARAGRTGPNRRHPDGRTRYELACVRGDRRVVASARAFGAITTDPPSRKWVCTCDPAAPERERPLDETDTLIDHWTPWEEDDRCWLVVALHPTGIGLKEIGELMGIGYEGVRLLEQSALRKLREKHPDVLRRLFAELVDRDEDDGSDFEGASDAAA